MSSPRPRRRHGTLRPDASTWQTPHTALGEANGVYNERVVIPAADGMADDLRIEEVHVGMFAVEVDMPGV